MVQLIATEILGNQAHALYQYFPMTLQQEQTRRIDAHYDFTKQELTYILKSLLQLAKVLDNSQLDIDLLPSDILLSSSG